MVDCAAQTGMIFNIQRYSLHDGSGIRTIVFMKGCPLRCVWCANPESQMPAPEIMVRGTNCIGCGMCLKACPNGALAGTADGIAHDTQLCVVCGACVKVCNADGITLAGGEISAGEVYKQIERDRIFYRHSGGGVTFSGGEPLMQPKFLAAMLRLCKHGGLSTVIETCGAAPWEVVESTMEDTDAYYYDIKVLDAVSHENLTGVNNRQILENLERLLCAGKEVLVRMPLVPGLNDEEKLDALCRYLRSIGIGRMQLLPYHNYGLGKYQAIGRKYELTQLRAPTANMMQKATSLLKKHNISAIIG